MSGADTQGHGVELRVVQISDTHLTSSESVTVRNFVRIADFVNRLLAPDLVVNTGDIVALDPDDESSRAAAITWHARFNAPVRFLPGNHDVGEPGDEPWMGIEVTSDRLAAHRAVFGDDRFVVDSEHWVLVGCNSELFGSGLPEEDEQWAFLEEAATGLEQRNAAIFLHKPIWPPRAAPSIAALSVPDDEAERLRLLFGSGLKAVASGHLHRYRRRLRDDLAEVWAPSTAFMGQTETEPSHFEQLGVVEWKFGVNSCAAAFRAPVDLEEYQLADEPGLTGLVEEFRARHVLAGRAR